MARASDAATGAVKNVQAWAPRPDCEISTAQGTPRDAAAFT